MGRLVVAGRDRPGPVVHVGQPAAVVSGRLVTQTAKAWFIDRMVLLYEDMKARDSDYAGRER